jgi:hypothetical protein
MQAGSNIDVDGDISMKSNNKPKGMPKEVIDKIDSYKSKMYTHPFSLGGQIGGLLGAVLNPSIKAISSAVADNKLNQFDTRYSTLGDVARYNMM